MSADRSVKNAAGALAGLRVLEFTSAMAGPWVGRIMASCGAEVIRVESRDFPDVVRGYSRPDDPEHRPRPTESPWFTDWNAGKLFVALDLRRPRGVELALKLAARADVVVENHAAGVMDRLGLGWQQLSVANPRLVMLSTSGYGATGPAAGYVSWGPNIMALSGMAAASGFEGRECTMDQYAFPDPMTALHGLFAVMSALEHRRQTGRGQYVDLSQFECTAGLAGELLVDALAGLSAGATPEQGAPACPEGVYRCSGEDRWLALSVQDDGQWAGLCRVLGRSAWLADAGLVHADGRLERTNEINEGIRDWTAERSPLEASEQLQAAGVAAAPVQNVDDQYKRDPQLRGRGFFELVEHLTLGTVTACALPLGLGATPAASGVAGAAVGEDNRYVLGELLGLSTADIAELERDGAVQPLAGNETGSDDQ